MMVKYIRNKGKKVISYNPGWNYKPGEIDMTQLWSYRGKAQKGIPAIDCRFHYANHFDTYADLVAMFNSRIYNQPEGSDDLAGCIVAFWNDRYIDNTPQLLAENNFYPYMLTLAERAWRGGGNCYLMARAPCCGRKNRSSWLRSRSLNTACCGRRNLAEGSSFPIRMPDPERVADYRCLP